MTDLKNSLQKFDHPADRIRQHMQGSRRPILVVEGNADRLILKDLLPRVDIFPVDGKGNVVEVARTLLKWSIRAFICITDNDFDDPEELKDIDLVHHPYDYTDLEAMLIMLGVLASHLEHVGTSGKLSAAGGSRDVVDRLISCVRPVLPLREWNARQKAGLPFDKVPLSKKIDKSRLELDIKSYCSALISKMDNSPPLSQVLAATNNSVNDPFAFRGKDVIEAAGVALRKLIGSLDLAATEVELLSAQIRSSSSYAISRSSWLNKLEDRLEGSRRQVGI